MKSPDDCAIIAKMKFVFFDIECACVHKTCAKTCAFGYVVCDENFNISEKRDILINPLGKFELTDRKGEKGIVLPYEYEEFKKFPSFPEVYETIKELLEDKDTYVLGHSVLNDVKYLNLETARFHLPSFNFRFSDSQLIYMTVINDFSHQFGLETIAESLNVEFTPHRAADDAYAAMRIVEAMCRADNCSYSSLMDKYNLTPGKISNYSISAPLSGGFRLFNREKRKLREERSRKRVKFNQYFSKKRYIKGGRLSGEFYTFSRAIEDDVEKAVRLVDNIYGQGGRYTQQMELCRVYVRSDDDDSGRMRKALANRKIKIINLDELTELLDD